MNELCVESFTIQKKQNVITHFVLFIIQPTKKIVVVVDDDYDKIP